MQLKEHESNDKISVIKRMKHTRNHSISQRFLVIEFIEPIALTSPNHIYIYIYIYIYTPTHTHTHTHTNIYIYIYIYIYIIYLPANSGSKTRQTNLRSKISNILDRWKQEIEYR